MKQRKLKLIYNAINNDQRKIIINILTINHASISRLSRLATLQFDDVFNHVKILERIGVVKKISKNNIGVYYKLCKLKLIYYKFWIFFHKYTIKGAYISIK